MAKASGYKTNPTVIGLHLVWQHVVGGVGKGAPPREQEEPRRRLTRPSF